MTGIVDYGETFSSDIFEVRNAADVLANAGTVTATITLPDGTTTAPSVANPATGQYTFDYLTAAVGLHSYVVSATGGATLGSLVRRWSGSFEVDDEVPLISFREGLAYLRIGQGELAAVEDREQLRWLCLTAGSVVSLDLQRVLTRRTVTDTLDGGVRFLQLSSTPAASITTVTEDGTTVAAGGYQLRSPMSGKLYRGGTTTRQYWASGWQNVAVTYVAGLAAVNTRAAQDGMRVARKVALNTLQGMWQSVQQSTSELEGVRDVDQFANTGTLTEGERAAYNSLRPITGFA